VDHLAKGLLDYNISILRIGNVSKVDEAILANTPEGKMADSKESKEIKKLKIKAEECEKWRINTSVILEKKKEINAIYY
jgi:hypothetical protein